MGRSARELKKQGADWLSAEEKKVRSKTIRRI
jgi:hypothetical protein